MDSKGLQRAGSKVKNLITNMLNNRMFMNIMKVILLLVIIKLVYDWWMGSVKTVTLLKGTMSGLESKTIVNAVDPDAALVKPIVENSKIGREFTLSMWLYINDWGSNVSEPQHVFHIGNEDQSDIVPGIWLYPKNNNIMIRMDTISMTDEYQATLNCHQNGQVLDTIDKAEKLCRSKGFKRVCTKKEVIDNKKSHNACCPSWTSTLNKTLVQGNITNNSGWYQGSSYIPKHEARAFKFKNKRIVQDNGGWSSISKDSDEKNTINVCREKCNESVNCSAYEFKEEGNNNTCKLWRVDASSPTYVPKNPELEDSQGATTVVPQTSNAICGSLNKWHSNTVDKNPRGVHCCGKSNKPGHLDTPDKPCDIVNIPVQRWVHLGLILQNKTLDVYLNGSLKRSCILKNIPKSIKQTDNIYINQNGGFNGKISDINYTPKALTSEDMLSEYSGFFGGKNTLVNKMKGPFADKDLSLSDVLTTNKKKTDGLGASINSWLVGSESGSDEQ